MGEMEKLAGDKVLTVAIDFYRNDEGNMAIGITPTKHVDDVSNEFLGIAAFMTATVREAIKNANQILAKAREQVDVRELEKEGRGEDV